MLDQGVVAVSPSTVFQVVREAGMSVRWTLPDRRAVSRQGFYPPKSPPEQWHTDMASINLRGTHPVFIRVLEGYSRSIVFRDLRMSITTADVELVLQRALETLPKGMTKPRIISDNGPHYLSTGFRSCLRDQEVVHSRIRVGHPSPTERSNSAIRPSSPNASGIKPLGGLEEDKTIIRATVHAYNNERLPSAINSLPPADYLKGEEYIKQRLEGQKTNLEQARQDRLQKQYKLRQVVRSA